jgi:hypothetical protein
MFVFAPAHVGMTAHGSKNKDDTGVHHVHAGSPWHYVVRLTSASPVVSAKIAKKNLLILIHECHSCFKKGLEACMKEKKERGERNHN